MLKLELVLVLLGSRLRYSLDPGQGDQPKEQVRATTRRNQQRSSEHHRGRVQAMQQRTKFSTLSLHCAYAPVTNSRQIFNGI